jgi:hypothetical protein
MIGIVDATGNPINPVIRAIPVLTGSINETAFAEFSVNPSRKK